MNENPYQSPESNLTNEEDIKQFEFYVVSISKFTILFFATLGMYELYWFYQNWKLYKVSNDEQMWPVARAIFSIFFVYILFGLVDDHLERAKKSFAWSPGGLAIWYILFSILGYVMDRLPTFDIGPVNSELAGFLLLPLVYFTLVNAQKAINLSQNDPEGESNSSYTPGNYLWIALGGVFWLFLLTAIFMEPLRNNGIVDF